MSVAAHVRHLRQAGETINVAGNAFGTASERLRQAAEPVSTALEKVEASARQATETLRVTSNTNDAMRDATTRLTDVSRTAGEAFNSYQSRFAETDRALGGTVKGLVDGSLQLSAQFGEIVSKLDTHLTQAVGSLSSGVEEIKSMAQELADAAADLRQMLNN